VPLLLLLLLLLVLLLLAGICWQATLEWQGPWVPPRSCL
jgi:hypothetical protein